MADQRIQSSNEVEGENDSPCQTQQNKTDSITTPSCIIQSQTDDLRINPCCGRRNKCQFYRPHEHLLGGKQERQGNDGINTLPVKCNNS